jgi:Fe-S-cluster containining protein
VTATPEAVMGSGAVEPALWLRWGEAVQRPEVAEGIRKLYDRLDQQVHQHGPVCWASGRCCRFDRFGHVLFVTGLEVSWLIRQARNGGGVPGSGVLPVRREKDRSDGCPFQKEGLCSVHALRPMGCRVFFCQRSTSRWQQELYERFLFGLRRLHEAWSLPYRYLEWRWALMEALKHTPAGFLDRGTIV